MVLLVLIHFILFMPAFFLSGEISLENTFYFSQFFSLLLQSWKPSWLFFLKP